MFNRPRIVFALGSMLLVVAGCGGQSSAAPGPADDGAPLETAKQQAPPPVSHLRGRALRSGVQLTWTASADVRYRVFRRAAAGTATKLARVHPGRAGQAGYLDRSARPGLVYRYWIVPENLWELRGDASAELTIRAR